MVYIEYSGIVSTRETLSGMTTEWIKCNIHYTEILFGERGQNYFEKKIRIKK